MKKFSILLILTLCSCISNKYDNEIVNQWNFVNIFEGEKTIVDEQMLNQKNEYGTGVLEFKNDLSFFVKKDENNDHGLYILKGNSLKMKYLNQLDTITFKVLIANDKYLLLINDNEKPHTWLYKKIKN